MNKIRAYVNGALIGMIGEYLFRVEFSTLPLMILILLIITAYIDIKYNNK